MPKSKKNIKAIIPVAGAGLRLRPLTYTQPKPLIPVAGKPILSFIIDQLKAAGIREFIFIIGYLGEKIKDYVQTNYPKLNATFVKQEERLGSAHAIYQAVDHFRQADELVIFFGDVIVDLDLRQFRKNKHSSIVTQRVDDPRQFGVVELNEDGQVRRLVEKPKIPKSNLAMVGVYNIKNVSALIDGLEFNLDRDIRSQDFFPLTDALMRMVERGTSFSIMPVDKWFDCGRREVLLETNAIFLDREGYASSDLPAFDNTILIHPVSIGKECKIKNSIIGPHVTIGNHVQINNAIVKNSIIGNYTSLQEVILRKSVVGNDTSITGMRHSLNIGDNTEIDLSS